MATKTVKKTTRRRDRKNIEKGAAHIHSSFNNTIVTFIVLMIFMGSTYRYL